jgi:hypothetical protein
VGFSIALNHSSAGGADTDLRRVSVVPPLFRFTNRLHRSGRVPIAAGCENIVVGPLIPLAILELFAELLGIHGLGEREAGAAGKALYALCEDDPAIRRTGGAGDGARSSRGSHRGPSSLLLSPSHLLEISETLLKHTNHF